MEDRRSVGASSCNSGDGTDQRVQSLMFIIIIITPLKVAEKGPKYVGVLSHVCVLLYLITVDFFEYMVTYLTARDLDSFRAS